MYSREWDQEAEEYLRKLLKRQESFEPGGLPDAYPTTGFETLWIASTFLQNGIEIQDKEQTQAIGDIVEEYYQCSNRLIGGFSKHGVLDGDCTSKSIILRNLLGKITFPDRLIERFENGEGIMNTYDMERDPSVSTNCHALLAILSCSEPGKYGNHIQKLVEFLYLSWTRSDVLFSDKWHNSDFYPMMLLSEALTEFLYSLDQCKLELQTDHSLSRDQACLVAVQVLNKILQCRNPDGSWGPNSSREITSYVVIALANLMSLPLFPKDVEYEITAAIEHGRAYLTSNVKSSKLERHWIVKTSYSPVNVSRAYIIAAEKVPYPKRSFGTHLTQSVSLPKDKFRELTCLYRKFPHLEHFPLWAIQGSVVESHFHLQKLQRHREDMFSREGLKADKYINFIVLNVVCVNNLQKLFIKTDSLFDLMVLVLRIYQVDEFAEYTIAKSSDIPLKAISDMIDGVFEELDIDQKAMEVTEGSVKPDLGQYPDLKALINSILFNRHFQPPSRYDNAVLRGHLHECLRAEVQQIADSRESYKSPESGALWLPPAGTLHCWLRNGVSAHSWSLVMCAFERCLLKRSSTLKDSPERLYLVQDLWMHLGNKGRLENDRASLQRDRTERNLNSLDFEEFRGLNGEQAQVQITKLIDYEKRCIDVAFKELDRVEKEDGHMRPGILLDSQILRFQHFFSDLYSDLYTLKDVYSEV